MIPVARTLLWILVSASLQRTTLPQLLRRGLDPSSPRLGVSLQGDDMVGQLTSLSGRLPQSFGCVTLIADQALRARALAIARQSLGTQAIQVEAPPARQLPSASPPEDPLRLHRDVLRVQLWTISGWDGRELGLWLRRSFH